jgi:large subunit ribosomal protein L3
MSEGLLGKKIGMTQIFQDNGEVIPASILQVGPCFVTQIKTKENDGYTALQIGFAESRRLNKPQRGHLKNLPPLKKLLEVRTSDVANFQVGQKLDLSIFNVGDKVDVSGVSKGKGHAGVIKRHHFKGGKKTHGQSDRMRRPGSSGATTTPGRVLKGMRGAGQLGNKTITTLNMEIVKVDAERNLMALKGSVPGSPETILFIRKARQQKKVSTLPSATKGKKEG